VKNLTALRTELADTFAKVKKGSIDARQADALTNVAGKIIATVQLQLKAAMFNKQDKHNIDFMD
jgi:hypothetical protein